MKDALDCIPNDDADYDTWLTIGMALHSTGAEWAKELWDEWAQQSAKYDPGKQEKSWGSFSADGEITIATLFHLAGGGSQKRAKPEVPLMYEGPRASESEWPPEPDDSEPPPWEGGARREIYATPTSITQPVDECLEALMEQGGNLYQRDGLIVAVQRVARTPKFKEKVSEGMDERDRERARIVPANTAYVQELATQAANWYVPTQYKNNRQYYKPGSCPERIIQHIQSRMALPFPVLTGVTTTPTLRTDGSVIDQPGYDAATGLYYLPMATYPEIKPAPTWDDAREAYTALCEPFEDYHFAADHDMSAAIAALLSIVVRHLVRTVPLFGVSANVRGAGKGLLVSVCSLAATGLDSPMWDETTDVEEERKRLLVIAISGDRVTCIDNVTRALGSGPLDRAITQPYAKGRVLGLSKDAEVELRTVFFATGNNLHYRGDMARRVVPIALSPQVERPEEREDFEHKNLFDWTRAEHPRLLAAAITLIKAYILDGKPKQTIKPYGSFEEWSNLVRSALVWVNAEDPCAGREGIEAENDDLYSSMVTLFEAWEQCYPVGQKNELKKIVGNIKDELDKEPGKRSQWFLDLGDALLPFDKKATRVADIDPLRLSRNLRPGKSGTRIINGMRLAQFDSEGRSQTKAWGLIHATGGLHV